MKAGENFILKTQLENTCLIDSKISEHNVKDSQCNSEGWEDSPVYSPRVEILEGEDIIRRSHLNYKNTLQSSENLEFLKPGLVKLKIKYEQLMTCKECLQNSGNYHTYSPEKIVDIIVE